MTVRRISNSPFCYYDFWYRKRWQKGATKQASKARAQDPEHMDLHSAPLWVKNKPGSGFSPKNGKRR